MMVPKKKSDQIGHIEVRQPRTATEDMLNREVNSPAVNPTHSIKYTNEPRSAGRVYKTEPWERDTTNISLRHKAVKKLIIEHYRRTSNTNYTSRNLAEEGIELIAKMCNIPVPPPPSLE